MQTFITSLNLEQSAYSLWENGVSGNRLQNQINEGLIILRTLTGWYAKRGRKGWPNHPVTKMWEHHTGYLAEYVYECIHKYELLSGNNCNKRYNDLNELLKVYREVEFDYINQTPPWLTEEFCSNHRSVLLGKAYESDIEAFDRWIVNYPNIGLYRKFEKAEGVLNWYQSLGWTEQPAVRVENNKWPYIWTTNTNAISRCAAGP